MGKKIKYFEGCNNLQALKERYKTLAKTYHPDVNPDAGDEIMQAINAEYDEMVKRLSRVSSDGCTQATEQEAREAQDLAEAFRAAVYAIIKLDGLNIELCGSWLWVSGETRKHRDALKAAGYMWASKKMMWYWRPADAACHCRSRKSMAEIRAKYGSERIKAGPGGFHPQLDQ